MRHKAGVRFLQVCHRLGWPTTLRLASRGGHIRSEIELTAQLQLPWITRRGDLAGRACVGAGGSRPRRAGCRQGVIDVGPLRMIEDVITLKPQLEVGAALCDVEVFEEGEVPVVHARAIDCVSVEVTVTSVSRNSK